MRKTILHCDLNCFFASAEMLYHPELRDVPMAVAGDPKDRHGIILAKNVPAKRMGVKTAETIKDALKKCPELVLRKPDYETYAYLSDRVRDLYYEYTDQIEPFGIDECWLDITHSISYFGSAQSIVDSLLHRIRQEIGLTLSIGISYNKVYAKLGSDLAKEDSFYRIDSLKGIRDLPVSALLGVGPQVAKQLESHGIHTIGDAADKPESYLTSILGKFGSVLHRYACGKADDEVSVYGNDHPIVKSISNSTTSKRDVGDLDDLKIVLTLLADNVARRLSEKGMYYKTVHLFLRNRDLKTRTLQIRLKENSDLGKQIYDEALQLFERNCDFVIPYRSVGVAVSDLSFKKDDLQTDLFSQIPVYDQKQKDKETAMRKIRERFGDDAIFSLRLLQDSDLSGIETKNITWNESE